MKESEKVMICKNCGQEIPNVAGFCSKCGYKVYQNTNESVKAERINLGYKIAIVILAITVAVMGTFLTVNLLSQDNDGVPTVNDANVETAIVALKQHWKDIYSQELYDNTDDKNIQITNTRVITLDVEEDDEFAEIVDNGEDIKYIVEFELYTNYYNSSPYHTNTKIDDTVIIYKNGTTKVTQSILRLYSTKTYSYDYDDFLVDIKDYGSAFNMVYGLD